MSGHGEAGLSCCDPVFRLETAASCAVPLCPQTMMLQDSLQDCPGMLLGDLCRFFTFPFFETRASISLFLLAVSQPLMLADSLRDCPGVLPADLMPPDWDGRPPPKATLHAVLQVGSIARFGSRALPMNETNLLLSSTDSSVNILVLKIYGVPLGAAQQPKHRRNTAFCP